MDKDNNYFEFWKNMIGKDVFVKLVNSEVDERGKLKCVLDSQMNIVLEDEFGNFTAIRGSSILYIFIQSPREKTEKSKKQIEKEETDRMRAYSLGRS